MSILDTKTLGKKIDVLDKGYIILKTAMVEMRDGELAFSDDLSAVNVARTSYMKESKVWTTREEKPKGSDEALHEFLLKAQPVPHSSPFRSLVFSVEVKAPLMVAREWFKHRVGCNHGPDSAELVSAPTLIENFISGGDDEGFGDPIFARNEVSRRYVTIEPEFYIPPPDKWRSRPENLKQGSGINLPVDTGNVLTLGLEEHVTKSLELYEAALKLGVAPEQARLVLPAYALYTIWRWTFSLQAGIHFLTQRKHTTAQYEIRQYALPFRDLIQPFVPYTLKVLEL